MFTALIITIMVADVIAIVKNGVTYRNRMIIQDAIYRHVKDKISKSKPWEYVPTYPDFDDMESYKETLSRFWDWGYKHILPPEMFEIIKPYIRSYKEVKND